MPNHVHQQLTIEADDEILKLIKKKVSHDGSKFDAEHIIAMPEALHSAISNNEESDKKKENIKKYGFPTWYEWANHWWGTKWGCYQANWVTNNVVTFQSAWSPAIKIIMALSRDFPEAKFFLKWCDESGRPSGTYTIEDGEILDQTNPEYDSEEGIDLRKEMGCFYEDEDD